MMISQLYQRKKLAAECSRYFYLDAAIQSVTAAVRGVDSGDLRYEALLKLIGELTGKDIDPEKLKNEQVADMMQRWEEYAQLKWGSQELEDAIDRTIEAIEGRRK